MRLLRSGALPSMVNFSIPGASMLLLRSTTTISEDRESSKACKMRNVQPQCLLSLESTIQAVGEELLTLQL